MTVQSPPFRSCAILLLVIAAAACGSPAGPSDAGSKTDAGITDAGMTDAGADAGMTDAGADAGASDAGSIAVEGAWDDDYGDTDITINDLLWGEDTVVSYDNATRSAITQTYAASMYGPNTFNKEVWTPEADGGFWYCTVTYGQMTESEAANTTLTANPANPADGGCPDTDAGPSFPWTYMTPHLPHIEVHGTWLNDAVSPSVNVVIDDTSWNGDSIIQYGDASSDSKRFAITKTIDASGHATYSKIVWLAPAGGSFYSCAVATGQSTAEAAEMTTSTADASTPATGGCGSAPWTKLLQTTRGG